MPNSNEIMVTSTANNTTNNTTKSSSSYRRRRRRRAATSSSDDIDEEKYHRASLVLEHYRSFRYSRSLDIILEHTEELDGCCADTDFHHFITSSPRYNKNGMKKTQTCSCLTSLVPDDDDDLQQQQQHQQLLRSSLGSIDTDDHSFLLLEDSTMMNYSPPSSLPANHYRST
jgi:hypothetical protein